MALLTVENITRAGLEASYTAVAASHTFAGGDNIFLHIVNGATAMNATFTTTVTTDGEAVADKVVAVGANEEWFVGPFPTKWYSVTVTVAFSDTTDGTCAPIKIPIE